jgi:hypothetical protein
LDRSEVTYHRTQAEALTWTKTGLKKKYRYDRAPKPSHMTSLVGQSMQHNTAHLPFTLMHHMEEPERETLCTTGCHACQDQPYQPSVDNNYS